MKKLLLLFACCPLLLNAQITVVLQPHYDDGNNTYIRSAQPDIPVVGAADMTAYAWTCSGDLCVGRGLFAFNFGNIPPNAIIDSATLYLYANTETVIGFGGDEPQTGNNAAYIYRVTENWYYDEVTWLTQPAISYDNIIEVPESTDPIQDYALDAKDIVQDYINDPANSFGFTVRLDDELNYYTSLIFCSSFHPDESRHPKLVITYSLPLSIEENAGNLVAVSPNPASTCFNLHFDQPLKQTTLFYVSDITGAIVDQLNIVAGTQDLKVDANSYANGIYFIRGAGMQAQKIEILR